MVWKSVWCVPLLGAALLGCPASVLEPGGRQPAAVPDHPSFTEHIRPLLKERCWSCHNDARCYGAPMRLMTWADTQRPVEGTMTPTYERILARATAPNNPMPPNNPLTTAEQELLRRWVAQGAVEGPDLPPPEAPQDCGVPELPAEPPFLELRAHGTGPGGSYPIPDDVPVAGDRYTCFAFNVPNDRTMHVTRISPIVDNPRVLHHAVLLKEQVPGTAPDGPFECDGHGERTAQTWAFLYAWAPGTNGLTFPEDVGLPLDPGTRLIVQLHYHRAAAGAEFDRSGIALHATSRLRPNEAGMLAVGPTEFRVDRHHNGATGTCQFPVTALNVPLPIPPFRVFTAFPHMHGRGASLTAEHLRFGRVQETFASVDRWSADAQPNIPVDVMVYPGDALRVSCRFTGFDGDAPVRGGPGSNDEMCYAFLYTTPPVAAFGYEVLVCPTP